MLQPLLHAIIIFIEMVIVTRLIAKFNYYYAEKPSTEIIQSLSPSPMLTTTIVLTIMMTNAVSLPRHRFKSSKPCTKQIANTPRSWEE